MFEKNLQIAQLLDCYGPVLSDRHRQLLDLYYNQDYSLGEIAAQVGISRQGVRDSIKKAEEELSFFEEGLHILENNRRMLLAGQALENAAGENTALRDAVFEFLRIAGLDPEENP